MNCSESLDWLHLRLDGEPVPDPFALQTHLAGCPDCRGLHAAIGRLTEGLRLLPTPLPPPGLGAAVARAVAADRRDRLRFRRTAFASLAAAACFLVALRVGWSGSGHPGDPVARNSATEVRPGPSTPSQESEAVSVRKGLYDSGNALVAVVSHAADQTLGQGKLLLPPHLPAASVGSMQVAAITTDAPAVWHEAGEGLSAGVEPFANKFRSAAGSMSFIWRTPAEPNRQ
jgi:hypothetical protein